MADTWKIFGITIIVLIALVALILIFQFLSRECNTNLDCQQDEYCAFNHKCTPLPSSNQTQTSLSSSIILGISIIIAALILKNYKKNKT